MRRNELGWGLRPLAWARTIVDGGGVGLAAAHRIGARRGHFVQRGRGVEVGGGGIDAAGVTAFAAEVVAARVWVARRAREEVGGRWVGATTHPVDTGAVGGRRRWVVCPRRGARTLDGSKKRVSRVAGKEPRSKERMGATPGLEPPCVGTVDGRVGHTAGVRVHAAGGHVEGRRGEVGGGLWVGAPLHRVGTRLE